jgi:hypothetical protein
MHQQYAKQGLAVISVSLDRLIEDDGKPVAAAEAAKARAAVEKFLGSNKAIFTNLLLEEPMDIWKARFGFTAPPCLFVFDRRGKWIRFDSEMDKIDHDTVEKTIVKLLAE